MIKPYIHPDDISKMNSHHAFCGLSCTTKHGNTQPMAPNERQIEHVKITNSVAIELDEIRYKCNTIKYRFSHKASL